MLSPFYALSSDSDVYEFTEKYFKENAVKMLLNRIDHTGRIGIKVA